MLIAFDFDGVLNNFPEMWKQWLNKVYNQNIEVLNHYNMGLNYPDLTYNEITTPLYDIAFWSTIHPVENCEEILNNISKYDDYIIVTSTDPEIWDVKYHGCIKNNFSFIPKNKFILCDNKSLIKCDVLIDDCPENFYNVEAYKILIKHDYNKDCKLKLWNDFSSNLNEAINFCYSYNDKLQKLKRIDLLGEFDSE